jgi:hypothetical protein
LSLRPIAREGRSDLKRFLEHDDDDDDDDGSVAAAAAMMMAAWELFWRLLSHISFIICYYRIRGDLSLSQIHVIIEEL